MKNILIVDDDLLIRYSLAAMLRDDRTRVKAVSTGGDALREAGASGCDICFLDINLPDMNGLDVMKRMKAVSPATGFIIMTAGEPDDETMKTIAENAILFLAKPFDLFQVRAYVGRVLERGRQGSSIPARTSSPDTGACRS